MSIKDLDLTKLTKLTSDFIDEHKCLECCKYYIAPTTSICGHTLCHTCWMGRRTCPECAKGLNRRALKPNIPFQTLTHHVQTLAEAFEKLFNVKLEEFNIDTPEEVESVRDPDKNVKNWLTSSQNHFSAQNTESFSQESIQPINPLAISANNVIIHTDSRGKVNPNILPKVIHVTPLQDDWDKIEQMPDSEDKTKSNENVVGPMDIEQFFVDDNQYTTDNPRRSSRKKDLKQNGSKQEKHEVSSNKQISKESSCETDKKSQKGKQTWTNVKRMRKEFSKLNKIKKNKLNVSIEMFKKTQNVKPMINTPVVISPQAVHIDKNTPDIDKENEIVIVDSNYSIDKVQASDSRKKFMRDNDGDTKIFEQQSTSKVSNENITTINANAGMNNSVPKNNSTIRISEKISNTDNNVNMNEKTRNKMQFIKKGALCPKNIKITTIDANSSNQEVISEHSEDIEISIKIGNTITNILIKKKNDVQVKINTDQEAQTSLNPHSLEESGSPQKEVNMNSNENNLGSSVKNDVGTMTNNQHIKVDNSISGKKNTASADTATAQFEITESVEKELSNIMEYEVAEGDKDVPKCINSNTKAQQLDTTQHENVDNIDDLNDLDIFNSGSVKEVNVQVLKEHAPSEILISTVCSKLKTQRNIEKRVRDNSEEALPKNKKVKLTSQQDVKEKNILTDSEPINYDAIMNKVFASIDADIEGKNHDTEINKACPDKNDINKVNQLRNNNLSAVQKTQMNKLTNQNNSEVTTVNLQRYFNENNSENIFSVLEKDEENCAVTKNIISQQVDDLLTPELCQNLDSSQENPSGVNMTNKSNKKLQDYDESDRSVVEETPQKNLSIAKLKRGSTSNLSQNTSSDTKKTPSNSSVQGAKSVINITETVIECNKSNRDITIVETAGKKETLETPLTITKFADHIIHKSTPVARKSLNFDNENEDIDYPDETLCPTLDVVAKTTQEKEFMSKAFERTPTTPVARPLTSKNMSKANRKYCLAASCLTSTEIASVKMLCAQRKWSYVDKYTKDITHLVVGVDKENKSQRSVKYMCALAASKWIVSFDWVNCCLQSNDIVDEECFEALDTFGEPGPRQSRIAKHKLFKGIKFYCMPPFSVLDVDTLKDMLTAAGGLVVNNMKEVAVSEGSTEPALLLAEPEHTQEDRFIYLAMEKNIVPVNYEWVLNCLGSYTLSSIQELLLCPSSLLPAPTAAWPEILLTQDEV